MNEWKNKIKKKRNEFNLFSSLKKPRSGENRWGERVNALQMDTIVGGGGSRFVGNEDGVGLGMSTGWLHC